MSESKRYWVIVHYETEIEAETEWDAALEIRMGNTIVENATVITLELPPDEGEFNELIQQSRREARKEEALSIIFRQLAQRTGNYSLLWERSSSIAPHIQSQLQQLSLEQLELLSLDALQFSTIEELETYLAQLTNKLKSQQ